MKQNLKPLDLEKLLTQNFPYAGFRGKQQEIISKVLSGQNILALMPTGFGKSLCYQFPAKITGDLVLVISPLIALMEDQVQKAKSLGIDAACINSTIPSDTRKKYQDDIKNGKYQLLFVTPERLRKREFLDAIINRKLALLAVDEAHCISLWGHDFRPDYAKISEFYNLMKKPSIMALTATATPEVQKDIIAKLNLTHSMTVIREGIERPNLSLNVKEVYGFEEKYDQLKKNIFENKFDGSVIVYFTLIKTLEEVSRALQRDKFEHLVYHGDLPKDKRRKNQKEFIRADKVVMLATPAFGLGIDKSNIEKIIHFETPGTLEAYFQEVGRAGRDGRHAECTLLYDQDDLTIQMEFNKWAYPEVNFIRTLALLIFDNLKRIQQEGIEFLKEKMTFKNRSDYRVESSISILERWGVLTKTTEYSAGGLEIPDAALGLSIGFPYMISEEYIDKNKFIERVDEGLKIENMQELLRHQNKKLLEMMNWIKNTNDCRLNQIYKYFGITKEADCGICDVCQGDNEVNARDDLGEN